jgi:UDP-GlcNAc:undecaprenyl-phosphate GlcNAc-1-phosphate transferase
LLGGVAIFLSFWLTVFTVVVYFPVYGIEKIVNPLVVACISSLIIMLVGIADDLYPFAAKYRLVLVALAVLVCVVYFPWLTKITNPWGGYFFLSNIFSNILVFCWFLGMTYTTKILDGLDGLATGIVSIGAFIIVLLPLLLNFISQMLVWLRLFFWQPVLGFYYLIFIPQKYF